jgi:acyl-CoA reductase-like NAD-dependent aldehyde dehydrogenase
MLTDLLPRTSEAMHTPPRQPFSYQLLLDGRWVESVGAERFTRESPAHDVPVGSYPTGSAADVDAAVAVASRAFHTGKWPRLKGSERAKVLSRVAGLIRSHAAGLAYIEALESGKPIRQSQSEMEGAAELWDYAAALCRSLYGDSYNTLGENMLGLVFREPIGIVGMITPWNFPLLTLPEIGNG